jgi:glycosyltransferase involved in cell wall biosynthesis
MSLKVGLVACCLNTEHMRGMGKYVFELLRQSQQRADVHWHMFGHDSRFGMMKPDGPNITTDIFSFRGDRFQTWEQFGLPLRIRGLDLDLLHATEGALPLWQPKPTVVTVHDTLAWEERPDTLQARTYWDHVVPAALRKCAAVVTISECSRTDILKRWPWLEPKLTVIPHGIDQEYFLPADNTPLPTALLQQLGGAPYAVYLGGAMKRKRADWAIEVIAASRQPELKLVMCGFGAAARDEATASLAPELRGRVLFAEFLSDPELRTLYRGARAVLYPTLYEGFGFPAVEAQAAGVPVIFSALGSLSELVGPLSFVVPPHDLQAWVAALDEAAMDGERRAEQIRAASVWARKFAWSESFDKHLAVYQGVKRAAAPRMDQKKYA